MAYQTIPMSLPATPVAPTVQFAAEWYYTSDVDLLTFTGLMVVMPPLPYRVRIISQFWEIRSKSGTISTNPTYSVGSNDSSYNDYCASQTTAGFTTQANETIIGPTNVNPGVTNSIAASGYKVNVTVAATGSSTPVLTARFVVLIALLPI